MQGSQNDYPHDGHYQRERRNFRHQGASEQSCEPEVWLVGNSLISDIDPEKLKGVNISKEVVMTVQQCSQAMRSVLQNIDTVAIQTVTNDVKHMFESQCVDSVISLVNNFNKDYSEKRLILSIPPPTNNNMSTKIKIINDHLEVELEGQVDMIDNYRSFSGREGATRPFFRDDVHLTNEGIRLLASNIKKKCLAF